jgi:hypothetical protein
MRGDRKGRGGRRGGGRPRRSLFALLALLSLPSCGYYSFTGASIPERIQTIAVPLAEDQSLGGVPAMNEALTDFLIERFARQTRLVLEPDENAADAVLTTAIEQYRNEPVAVTGDEVAALNRVTIAVDVRYVDQVESEELLARTFTASAEYDATQIADEEETAVAVLRQIADDVFTAATSDW